MTKHKHNRKDFKAIALRITQDAPMLVERLRAGKTCKQLAKPYSVSPTTFWRYLQEAIDSKTWSEIMHLGNPKYRKPKAEPDIEEVRIESGPTCFHCTRPISRRDTVCPHCTNLL